MPGLRRLPLLAALLLAVVLAVPVSAASPAKPSLHPLGFVRTPVERGIKEHGKKLIAAYAATPASVDLSAWAPPVGNQGNVGSCTSWATGWGMRYWLRNHALGETTTFGPMYLYAQIVKGVNTGTSFSSNFNILDNQGIAPGSAYATLNQAYYDYTTQPTPAQQTAAAPYKATSYQMLFSGANAGNQATIQAAMAAGTPVMVAIPVYPEFDNVNSSNGWLVNPPVAGETSRGGHALFAPKYDANGLWIENSWGAGWGNAGYAVLSWAFINQNAYEAWTLSSSSVDIADGTTVVSSFSPASGSVGSSVTVSGLNFTGATGVTFGGTPAAFTVATDTQLTTTVPAGATSGPISVTGVKNTGTSAGSFTVTLPATTLTYNGSTSALPGAAISLSATLTDAGGPMAGRTVSFTLNGAGYSGTTDVNGLTSAAATAPATPGSYGITASYAGDATHAPSSSNATLTVSKVATTLAYTGPTQVTHGQTVSMTATLKTGGVAFAGQVVTFTIGSKKLTALPTDASGVATVSWTAPKGKGSQKVVVSYAGNATYGSSSVSATLKIV